MNRLRIVTALSAALLLAAGTTAGPVVTELPGDSVYQLPAAVTDANGHNMAFEDLQGRPRLVAFFYTNCPYVCPLVVESLRAVERQLSPGEQRRLGFVLITMDTERDTPEALRQVTKTRQLDPERWTLLRPLAPDLRALAGVLGFRYRALSDGEFNHSTPLVLLDAEGRVVARMEQAGLKPPAEFLAAVHRVSAE